MRELTFFELFAGVGGMSMGLECAGWRCVGHAEIEAFPRQVLAKRWPSTWLERDVIAISGGRKMKRWMRARYAGTDLLSGGSPCQDISVAGNRRGMVEGSGTRSSLFFRQVRLWKMLEIPYFLWENVPGAFSSNGGRDFAAVLSSLVGSAIAVPTDGWRSGGVAAGRLGVAAWRVLDAQFFGVPQRRRRVFVLCARTGGVDPAEVLSLSEGLRGDPSQSREARERAAAHAPAGVGGYDARYFEQRVGRNGRGGPAGVASALRSEAGAGDSAPCVVSLSENQRGELRTSPIAPQLSAGGGKPGQGASVVVPIQEIGKRQSGTPQNGVGYGKPGDPMYTLQAGAEHGVVAFSTEQTPKAFTDGVAPTLRQPSRSGGGQPDCVVAFDTKGTEVQNETNLSPTLRAMQEDKGHANGGGQMGVVSFSPGNLVRGGGADPSEEVFPALVSHGTGGHGDQHPHFTRDKDGAPSEIASPLSADADKGDQEQIVVALDGFNQKADAISAPLRVGRDAGDLVFDARGNGDGKSAPPITGDHANRVTDYTAVVFTQQALGEYAELDVASSLKERDYKDATDLVVEPRAVNISNGEARLDDVMGTLQARTTSGTPTGAQMNAVLAGRPRRLMPVECERLQGWPDGHTDVAQTVPLGRRNDVERPASDSQRYKACGNGIASPVVAWIGFQLAAAIASRGNVK